MTEKYYPTRRTRKKEPLLKYVKRALYREDQIGGSEISEIDFLDGGKVYNEYLKRFGFISLVWIVIDRWTHNEFIAEETEQVLYSQISEKVKQKKSPSSRHLAGRYS